MFSLYQAKAVFYCYNSREITTYKLKLSLHFRGETENGCTAYRLKRHDSLNINCRAAIGLSISWPRSSSGTFGTIFQNTGLKCFRVGIRFSGSVERVQSYQYVVPKFDPCLDLCFFLSFFCYYFFPFTLGLVFNILYDISLYSPVCLRGDWGPKVRKADGSCPTIWLQSPKIPFGFFRY